MKNIDLAVIGAGPAGLTAAIEASKYGVKTLVIDENSQPGGQLFKQIHKFFGSKEQMAGIRGNQIGKTLFESAKNHHVEIKLDAQVIGINKDNILTYIKDEKYSEIKARKIILSCGATEKPLSFPGWTLPGIMGAGAAQTLVNINKVVPGKKVLMVGSGNVGLIVSYHLLQAGIKVVAIIDVAQQVKGYDVHAAKIKRAGIPIILGFTINRAIGNDHVEKVELVEVDSNFKKIPDTQVLLDIDTVCLAVGLSPSVELAQILGCKLHYNAKLGGYIPIIDQNMQTSVDNIYAVGDMTGIEEASVAMEEGRLAGLVCADDLGCYTNKIDLQKEIANIRSRLSDLRKDTTNLSSKTLIDAPGIPSFEALNQKPLAVIECMQPIPCNPCEKSCPFGAITIGKSICNLPVLDTEKCRGCSTCIACCPGLAIFLVDMNYTNTTALVKIPYEFYPLPKLGMIVNCLNREGIIITTGHIRSITTAQKYNKTYIVGVEIDKSFAMDVRNIRM